MSFKSCILALTLSVTPLAALADDAKIVVMDPYARSSTPSSKSGAIFLELMNHGGADRLIAAATPVARDAQLHTHEEDANGVMRMIHVEEGFDVPMHGSLKMARGGKHVMLMGLTAPLEDGATIPLTLTFEQAGAITVDVVIDQTRKPAAHGGHEAHDEGHGHGHSNDS